MNQKFVLAYMDTAERFAQLSYAKRNKVGAIVVKDNRIVSIGYNGMAAGLENECEVDVDGNLVTKREVVHAEMNALGKLAGSTESGVGADLFVTLSPCVECAKLIATTGIRKVYYRQAYRDASGLELLKRCKVETEEVL